MRDLNYFVLLFVSLIAIAAWSEPRTEDVKFYRDLTNKIRTEATFMVPMVGGDHQFNYIFELGSPIYSEPIVVDTQVAGSSKKFYRSFWDRIFVKDGSRILLNGQEIPLTCIFVDGQDNRHAGFQDPRFPDFIMKVYLVANDYTCTGPLNPGFPLNGGKEQTWDTYLYFEVRDPTIMLPVEAKIRYRWNESNAVLVK